MIRDHKLNGNKEKHLFGFFPQKMLNVNELTPRAFKINLRCVLFSNVRVLHNNMTPKRQSIKLIINGPKQKP